MAKDQALLDANALAPVLEREVEGFAGLRDIRKFNTGQSNPTYLVTAQSHYRAMALLTDDDSYNVQIADAKATFADLVNAMEQADPDEADFFAEVRAVDEGFGASSDEVLALYEAGDIPAATTLHINEEHTASHALEAQMRELIMSAGLEASAAQANPISTPPSVRDANPLISTKS